MNSYSEFNIPEVSPDEIMKFLQEVLSSQDAYKNLAKKAIHDIVNYDLKRLKLAIAGVIYALISPEVEPMSKLLAIRFVKDIVETNSLHVIDAVKESEILPLMLDIGLFEKSSSDDNRGRLYFGKDADKNTQTVSNSFFRLILETIKIWSKWYSDDSSFRNVYENMLNQGVKFPQTYLYYKNANEAAKVPEVHPEYRSRKEVEKKNAEKKSIIDQEEEKKEELQTGLNGNKSDQPEALYESYITNLAGSRELLMSLISIKEERELDRGALNLVVQTLLELNKSSSKMIENLLTATDPKLSDLFLDRILKEQDHVNNILTDYDRWSTRGEINFDDFRSKYMVQGNNVLGTPNRVSPNNPQNDSLLPDNAIFVEIKPEESSRAKEKEILKARLLSSLESYKAHSPEYIKQIQQEKYELALSLFEIVEEYLTAEPVVPLKAVLSLKLLKDIMDQKKETFVYEFEKNHTSIMLFLKTCALFRKDSTDVNRGKYFFGTNQGSEVEKLSLTFSVMNIESLLVWSRWWPKSSINNNEKSIFLLTIEQILKELLVLPEKLNYFKNENYGEILKEITFFCIQDSQERAQTLSSSISDSNINLSYYNQKVLENFMSQTYCSMSKKNNDLLLESPAETHPAEFYLTYLKELKARTSFLKSLQGVFDQQESLSRREKEIQLLCEEIKSKFLMDLEINEGIQIFQEVAEQIEPQQVESDNKRSERTKFRSENSPKIVVISESQNRIDEVNPPLDSSENEIKINTEANQKIMEEINMNLASWDKIKSRILAIFEEEEKGGLLNMKPVSESLREIVGDISSFLFSNKRVNEVYKNSYVSLNKQDKMKVEEFMHLETTKNMAEKFLEDFERVEAQRMTYNRFRDRYQRLLGESDFSHTSSFYEINSDVDERRSVNNVFYLETQLVVLKEKYNYHSQSENFNVSEMKKEERQKSSQKCLSYESPHKNCPETQMKNPLKINEQQRKATPARIIYISNLDPGEKKIIAKGAAGARISRNQPSSATSHRRNNSTMSSFKTMFDDNDEYKIPLKTENKKQHLVKSDIIALKNPAKKGLGLEINLAKENMDLKEKLYELAEMNLKLIEENQILRDRLSKHENINDLLRPRHKRGLRVPKENSNGLMGDALEDKLSSSMCIHSSEVNHSFRSKNFKTMKTLDDAGNEAVGGEKEAVLAQLNEFSKQQHLKKYEFSKKKEKKVEEVSQPPSKRVEVKHLSSALQNELQTGPPASNKILRGKSQENYEGGNANLNSSFDSKRIFDTQNNVNEPSAIPMAGSQNFFSRPSSQNNIVFQEEYQYIPGLEGKLPSGTESRRGSRLEVVNNRADPATGVSRIESLLENIDREGFDERKLLNKNNLYDMERVKDEFNIKERKPSVILVNNQIVAQEIRNDR